MTDFDALVRDSVCYDWLTCCVCDSVTTAYCVERIVEPFADYASCNGPDTEHYTCTCNNWIDRCIARDDTSVCNASHLDVSHMPSCKCSEASLARSSKVIGRMPVRFHIGYWCLSQLYLIFPFAHHSFDVSRCTLHLHCSRTDMRVLISLVNTHRTKHQVSLVIGFPCHKQENAQPSNRIKDYCASQTVNAAGRDDLRSISCMASSLLNWVSTPVKSKTSLNSSTIAILFVWL